MFVNGAIVHIDQSAIVGNTADFGGGLGTENSRTTITNTTIHGNVASVVGGGIDSFARPGDPATLDLRNVTLAENSSPSGANIRSGSADAHVTFRYGNSLIYNTLSSVGEEFETTTGDNATAEAISLGGNVTDQGVPGRFETASDHRLNDLLIGMGPLMISGGVTPTVAPNPLDWAVDRGINELAMGPGDDLLLGTADDVPLLTDQRGSGFNRAVDGISGSERVDSGAFEVQERFDTPNELVVTNTDDVLFYNKTTDLNDLSLREATQIANLVDGKKHDFIRSVADR